MPPSHPPPLRLVDSDEQAPAAAHTLDSAFRAYARYVAAIGFRLLGRSDEVEDLVQDVFVRASRGLGALREPAALKAWLATVTVRVAQRRLRSRRLLHVLRLDGEYDYTKIAQPGFTPEQTAMLAETYKLLDDLSAPERLAWSLRHLEGESLERVAELTGASLATVKRRIAAASRHLQEQVDA